MKKTGLVKWIGIFGVSILTVNSYSIAQDLEEVVEEAPVEVEVEEQDTLAEDTEETDTNTTVIKNLDAALGNVALGQAYFEGSKRLKKGGPACITCHNVTNDKLIPGGLLAVDLTAIYPKYGAALSMWLENPDNAPMTTSYTNHPMTELERASLAAFLKFADEVKGEQSEKSGYVLFLAGGGAGLVTILILISLLWMKRKKQMVKKDIFARQSKAWDAKH